MNDKLCEMLKNAKSVAIIAHISPDADALCSMVLLKNFLVKSLKKRVDLFSETDEISEKYSVILKDNKSNKPIKNYHTAIVLDCPNLPRVGKYGAIFEGAKQTIVIDHHDTNNFKADVKIVKKVSSTCEILYALLKKYKYEFSPFDYGIVYAGIITDTNNLSVGAMNSNTFKIISECFPHIDQQAIYNHFFSQNTLRNMKLFALAIENIVTFSHGKIIITHITHEEAKRYKAGDNDYVGIINRLATISGNKLVCFSYPKGEEYYVSMRAKRGYDCSQIALTRGGGGHKGASAYLSNERLQKIEQEILQEFTSQIQNAKQQIKQKIF